MRTSAGKRSKYWLGKLERDKMRGRTWYDVIHSSMIKQIPGGQQNKTYEVNNQFGCNEETVKKQTEKQHLKYYIIY